LVVRRFADIVDAVSKLLDRLPGYRQHVAAMENRALFEAVEILKTIASGTANRCCNSHLVPPASVASG
jgi:hypothetical protein